MLKISNKIRLRFGMVNSINTHLRLKIPPTTQTFNLKKLSIEFTKPKLSLKYIIRYIDFEEVLRTPQWLLLVIIGVRLMVHSFGFIYNA